ncbi:hypothetical protein [Neobacillus niacini]|uniref:hypothetical protein n=1 Tax=Neobacillus niacini TaxID=86668 RepID=UPI0020412622|nr:hypothetical protein [Neobacillus niacini]MCM3692195.1 hypothetical protein [Neobacillus niacini]
MIVLADGFMSSALLLTKQVLMDNSDKKADSLIYPILFNTNHGIEVYLKAISWSLNILTNTGKEFRTNHNLNDLLQDVKSLVYSFECDKEKIKVFEARIEPLDNYIKELYSKIENVKPNGKKFYSIDFSRYSLTIQGEPQFYINEFDNVVVDMENFVKVFNQIHKSLDGFASHFLYDYEDH